MKAFDLFVDPTKVNSWYGDCFKHRIHTTRVQDMLLSQGLIVILFVPPSK